MPSKEISAWITSWVIQSSSKSNSRFWFNLKGKNRPRLLLVNHLLFKWKPDKRKARLHKIKTIYKWILRSNCNSSSSRFSSSSTNSRGSNKREIYSFMSVDAVKSGRFYTLLNVTVARRSMNIKTQAMWSLMLMKNRLLKVWSPYCMMSKIFWMQNQQQRTLQGRVIELLSITIKIIKI